MDKPLFTTSLSLTLFCCFIASPFSYASSIYEKYKDYKGPYSATQPIVWMAIVDKANGGDEIAQQTLADNVLDISEYFLKKIKILEWGNLTTKMKSSPVFLQFVIIQGEITYKLHDMRHFFVSDVLENHFSSDSAISQNIMGMIYEKGLLVKQDNEKSCEFYVKSAEQDYELALINLAKSYDRRTNNGRFKAYKTYLDLVDRGYLSIGYKIARLFQCGYSDTNFIHDINKAMEWYDRSRIFYDSQVELKKILKPIKNLLLTNKDDLQQEADYYCDTINGSISEIYAMAKQNDLNWSLLHYGVAFIQVPSQHKKLMKLYTALEPVAKLLPVIKKPGFMITNLGYSFSKLGFGNITTQGYDLTDIGYDFSYKKAVRLEERFIQSFKLGLKGERKIYTSYGRDNVRQTLSFYDLINELGHLAPTINKFYKSYQKSCQSYFNQILDLQTQGNVLIKTLAAPEDFEKMKSQYGEIQQKIKAIQEDQIYLDHKHKKKVFKVIKSLADDLPKLVDKFTPLRNYRFQEDPETSFLFQ